MNWVNHILTKWLKDSNEWYGTFKLKLLILLIRENEERERIPLLLLSNIYFLPGPMKYFWHGRLGFPVVEDAPLSGPSFLQLKQKLKSSITVYRNAILMSFQKKLILCILWPITFACVCLPRVVLNRAIHSIDARLLMASRNSPLTPSKFWGSKLVCRTHKLNFSFKGNFLVLLCTSAEQNKMAASKENLRRNNCWFARDFMAAILVVKNKNISNSLKQLYSRLPITRTFKKSKKVRVIGSSKEIVGSKVKNIFYCTVKEMSSEN